MGTRSGLGRNSSEGSADWFSCAIEGSLCITEDGIRSMKHKVAWSKFTYINANADFNVFVGKQCSGVAQKDCKQ